MWQQKQLLNQYHSEDRSKAKDNDKLKEYKIVFDGKIIGRYHPNNPLRNDNIKITDHRIPTKRAGNVSLEIIFSDWSGNKVV